MGVNFVVRSTEHIWALRYNCKCLSCFISLKLGYMYVLKLYLHPLMSQILCNLIKTDESTRRFWNSLLRSVTEVTSKHNGDFAPGSSFNSSVCFRVTCFPFFVSNGRLIYLKMDCAPWKTFFFEKRLKKWFAEQTEITTSGIYHST